MNVGGRIREIRLQQHLTLQELSKLCGISVSHVSEIERGKTPASAESVLRIANALRRPPSALIDGADDWDAAKQAMLDYIVALGQSYLARDRPLSSPQLPPAIPADLLALRDDPVVGPELTEAWLEWLASLTFAGRKPSTAREWLSIHIALYDILGRQSRQQ